MDMTGAFLAQRSLQQRDPKGFYEIIDGGVFDNIPISRAFRAIRPIASSTPTRRALVYLDPTPPSPPSVADRPGAKRGDFVAVVFKSLRGKTRTESALEDENEIAAYQASEYLRRGRLETLAVALEAQRRAQCTASTHPEASREAAYVRYRTTADSAELAQVLADPEAWRLSQGIPASAARPPKSVVDEWDSQLRAALNTQYNEANEEELDRFHGVSRGAGASRDAALLLITCVQWLENESIDFVDGRMCVSDKAPFLLDRALLSSVRDDCYKALRLSLASRNRRIAEVLDRIPSQIPREPADSSESQEQVAWTDGLTDTCARWMESDADAAAAFRPHRAGVRRNAKPAGDHCGSRGCCRQCDLAGVVVAASAGCPKGRSRLPAGGGAGTLVRGPR